MRQRSRIALRAVFVALAAGAFQAERPTGPELIAAGRLEEALAVYVAAVEKSPQSVAANNGAGVVLDLLGRYSEGHTYFTRAVQAEKTHMERALAQRALAIGRVFAGNCRGAEKYEQRRVECYLV